MKVWDFFPEVMSALEDQLEEDDKVHGDEWLKRTRKGQEDRIFDRLDNYYMDWFLNEVPIPWLKIIGLAMIGWLREKHPEVWPE